MKNMHSEEIEALKGDAEEEIRKIEEVVRIETIGEGDNSKDKYFFLQQKNKEIREIRERLSFNIKEIKESTNREESRYGWIALWKKQKRQRES